MTPRSLLGIYVLLASSAVVIQSAEAAVYNKPNLSNPIEAKIQTVRTGSWKALLQENQSSSNEGNVARAWGNGGGRAWGNGGGRVVRRGWGNGGGWGTGGGGWMNGGYGGRGFANW